MLVSECFDHGLNVMRNVTVVNSPLTRGTSPMPTIFICDDETDILTYLDKLLRASGYSVEVFSRGIDLLARLKAADKGLCDVILQDVRMPDMDGLQVLE